MANAGKEFKGQLVTTEGSLTGSPLVTSLFDYTALGDVEFLGEAEWGSQTDQNRWVIQKMFYDADFNVTAIKMATNLATTKATAVTVDVATYAPDVGISIVGGDFALLEANGDQVMLDTASNKFTATFKSKVSSTTVVVSNPTATPVGEVSTTIDDSGLTLRFQAVETKDIDRRRWDHRDFYQYV